ncbi:MAG: hypothetical protein ACKPKO_51795, partial [Candidatus Fonsibacter sp.]
TEVDTALGLKANQATTYTKTEVQQLFLNLIDNAPASLDTLNELANALANDANYATTVQNQLATKANTSDVYNKLYIDTLIAKYYLKTETYNQTEIYNKLALKLNPSIIHDYYNKLYIDT